MKKIIYNIIVLSFLFTIVSCDDNDLEPTLSVNKDLSSISSVEDLRLVMSGVYNRMTDYTYYGRDLLVFGDVRSDNAYSNGKSGRFVTVAAMDMVNSDLYPRDTFTQIYRVIASCNIVANSTITGNTPEDKAQIDFYKGQALAIRALAHYDLLRIFGQQHVGTGGLNALAIPYTTAFRDANLTPTRNTVGEVKGFILADLNAALALMDADLNTTKETITTSAVNAIKARVALYFEEWQIAKDASRAAINSSGARIATKTEFAGTYATTLPVNSIFELASRSDDNQGNNSLYFIYAETVYGDITVLKNLKDQYSATDVRGSVIGTDSKGKLRNLGKFVSLSSNVPVIRFEEMVLINAEASFMLNNSDPSVLTSMNSIASNRGADLYTTVSRADILKERRKELAFEGFRFDDLARTKSDMPIVDAILQTYDEKGAISYGSYRYAFPIPLSETNANANFIQNVGY